MVFILPLISCSPIFFSWVIIIIIIIVIVIIILRYKNFVMCNLSIRKQYQDIRNRAGNKATFREIVLSCISY